MTDRVDAAWNDPLALWGLIVENEAAEPDAAAAALAELGQIAEHLFVDAAAARADAARLRAEVHSLACTRRWRGSVAAAPPG